MTTKITIELEHVTLTQEQSENLQILLSDVLEGSSLFEELSYPATEIKIESL